jgi:hypothetical protein
LLELVGAWSVLASATFVLTLGAGVGTAFAIASIWRLRRDARAIEAAESFEAVDLTSVVKRYVPGEYQTNIARDEMAIAKQAIAARRPRLRRLAVVFGMAGVCGAAATVFSAQRHLEAAAARSPAKPHINLDVLSDVQGVWGWRADFLQSCSQNPQTIQVAPDQKTLTLRYAKPNKQGSETINELNFDVVAAKSDMLVLLWTDPPAGAKPSPVEVHFIDANTMSWSSSNDAMVSSGAIERCPLTQHTPSRR